MKKSERKFIRTILENMLEYKTVVLRNCNKITS